MRRVQSVEMGLKVLKAQVFKAADYIGIITAEEYARAAFRFFVAALPIATGLLQHSASVRLLGSNSKQFTFSVDRDSRGNSAPVTEWSGDHWRTRIAYGMAEDPFKVQVKLVVRDAFALKRTGIAASGGKFGLVFNAGRSNFAEPEFVNFLRRINEQRILNGEPAKEYEEVDVARVNAVEIYTRSMSMRPVLTAFLDEAKMNIERRVKQYNKRRGA